MHFQWILYGMAWKSANEDHCVRFKVSDFIWDFGNLPFPLHLGRFFKDFGENTQNTKQWEIKAICRLGMTPLKAGKIAR